jgi:hypothetical protein
MALLMRHSHDRAKQGEVMTGVDVQELSLDDHRLMVIHERVMKHFSLGIEHLDEELGPGKILSQPQLLAAFVTAAALESLAAALQHRVNA